MTQQMFKFPSIEQFRTVRDQVKHKVQYIGYNEETNEAIMDRDAKMPTLKFKGTIKLHGTNAAIVFSEGEIYAQSRKNVITVQSDNAGFAAFLEFTKSKTNNFEEFRKMLPEDVVVRIYGEWCGGNIQKGVAINGLDKMFVIFAIKVDDVWMKDEDLAKFKLPEYKIYNILDYPTYEVDIDFEDVTSAVEIMEELTLAVEEECPVGKAFGNTGIGEGIVWKCVEEGYNKSRFWFKVKGLKHQSTKTKKVVQVDIEKVNSMNELVSNFLTESRLEQGLDYLRQENLEFSRKNLGVYLKWVVGDIFKEELDTIMENGFEPKQLTSPISNQAREWFFKKEAQQ